MTDNAFNLLVITPACQVRDYAVPLAENSWATARAVLHALRDQIGCHELDAVKLTPEIDMWVDDQAALKPRLRVNHLGSYIATRLDLPFQLYVGTVVFCGGLDADGNPTSLSGPSRETLLGLIAELRSIRWGR